jgi:hypothetical protein
LKQTLLSNYATSAAHFTVEASTIPYNSRGNPRTKQGRTPTYLTGPELKDAMQYYFSSNVDEKQRILQRFGQKKIRYARAICKLDVGKQGKIGRHICSFHGAKYLVYNYLGPKDGVRIRCFAAGGCSFNTHHDGYLYAGVEKQFDESAEM